MDQPQFLTPTWLQVLLPCGTAWPIFVASSSTEILINAADVAAMAAPPALVGGAQAFPSRRTGLHRHAFAFALVSHFSKNNKNPHTISFFLAFSPFLS